MGAKLDDLGRFLSSPVATPLHLYDTIVDSKSQLENNKEFLSDPNLFSPIGDTA